MDPSEERILGSAAPGDQARHDILTRTRALQLLTVEHVQLDLVPSLTNACPCVM